MVCHVQLSEASFYYPNFQNEKGPHSVCLHVCISMLVLYVCVSGNSTCLPACVCPGVHMRLACALLTAPTVQKEALRNMENQYYKIIIHCSDFLRLE
jgi:hypothetical protein